MFLNDFILVHKNTKKNSLLDVDVVWRLAFYTKYATAAANVHASGDGSMAH